MESVYKINPELDVPIYQQLVDSIRAAIKNGALPVGQQLPTVQEMTEKLGIARGTIKRAYDELELAGLVEKAQGRGTFVRYQPADSASRKEQAMAAIDDMLGRLEQMGFSPMEINIFLDRKLREKAEQEAFVKVALVECNPECLSHMSEQLNHIDGVDLHAYHLESIEQYPYQLNEDFDLVVTTSNHGDYLAEILPDKVPLARTALRPSAHSLARQRICKSRRHLHRSCRLLRWPCLGLLCRRPRLCPLRYHSRIFGLRPRHVYYQGRDGRSLYPGVPPLCEDQDKDPHVCP